MKLYIIQVDGIHLYMTDSATEYNSMMICYSSPIIAGRTTYIQSWIIDDVEMPEKIADVLKDLRIWVMGDE